MSVSNAETQFSSLWVHWKLNGHTFVLYCYTVSQSSMWLCHFWAQILDIEIAFQSQFDRSVCYVFPICSNIFTHWEKSVCKWEEMFFFSSLKYLSKLLDKFHYVNEWIYVPALRYPTAILERRKNQSIWCFLFLSIVRLVHVIFGFFKVYISV